MGDAAAGRPSLRPRRHRACGAQPGRESRLLHPRFPGQPSAIRPVQGRGPVQRGAGRDERTGRGQGRDQCPIDCPARAGTGVPRRPAKGSLVDARTRRRAPTGRPVQCLHGRAVYRYRRPDAPDPLAGAGSRTAGFNLAAPDSGTADELHTHPVSDECLVMWRCDSAEFFIGGTWLQAKANDVALAPCGVAHGHRSEGVTLFGGYASPPQLDLLMPTEYYATGAFTTATATQLHVGD